MSLKHKNEYRTSIDEYQPANPVRRKIGLYWILAALRIALTLAPQTGYIHPDEFFQSIEVVSGEHFDIEVNKPWEFNATFPVRTAFVPQLVVGLPYVVLKTLSPYTYHLFGLSLKTPYFFVIFPRLFMCALSFLSDYFLYKICCMYGQNYRVRLVTYASSYIMLTYATRVLSNSVELVLTAALLYLVSKCMVFSEKVVLQSDYIGKKYSEATSGTERLKYYKLRALLPSHSLNHCFKLATITVMGVFNRPTFVAFALAPVFFWLQRGLGSKSVSMVDFHIRIFIFILYGLPAALLLILVDSFYYGYLTTGEIGQLEVGLNNFVVTPVNFIRYNIDTKNLESHGLHPRFLHFLVNVPLLFSILGLIGLLTFAKMMYRALTAQWLRLPRLQSIVGLMTTAFIVPVTLLSLFPHQEPRFIIPVLLPLVFLYAPELNQVPSLDIVQRASFNNDGETKRHKSRKLVLWYISNLLLAFFYAFAHQGGILPLTFHVATEMTTKGHLIKVHLYTSYSYSMPTALLHLRHARRIYGRDEYKLPQDFHLYEQGSKRLPQVFNSIARSVRDCEEKRIPYRLYYALPASAMDELAMLSNDSQFRFRAVEAFYPHVSVERLPLARPIKRLGSLFSRQNDGILSSLVQAAEDVREYIKQFKLILLRVYFVPKTKRSKISRLI